MDPSIPEKVKGLNLRPEERIVSIDKKTFLPPSKHLSTLKAIENLTAAPRQQEIGKHGPSKAANVTKEHSGQAVLKLYDVFFLRDGAVVARFLKDRYPQLREATVLETVKFTGVRDNLQPTGLMDLQEQGKAPHETRDPTTDKRAQELTRDYGWGWPYYGAIDTTGKNVLAIAEIALQPDKLKFLLEKYTGLDGEIHTIEDALHEHINWIRKRMQLNPDGLVESLQTNPKHHANDDWDDSPDSMHHADGQWPNYHPERNWGVASLRAQAEIYDALTRTIDLYHTQTATTEGTKKAFLEAEIADLSKRATQLKEVILNKFWVEDPKHYGGFFARGTDRNNDGNLRPMAIRTASMGLLLNTGILDGDDPEVARKREAVIRNIFSPEMLCPSGIRTLSSDSVRYFEDSYHNGSSWPWVTYEIALGLQKHGYYGLSYELKKRAWSLYNETKILPEYGTGNDDPNQRLVNTKIVIEDPTITSEPIHPISQWPQEIQAWTAAAILTMKQEEANRLWHKESAIPTHAINLEKRSFEDDILSGLDT
jgi:glycogen debranching enzyme